MGRVVHFEFRSENPDELQIFYVKVFGWDFSKAPGMDYRLIMTGQDKKPGINGGFPVNPELKQKVVNTIDVDDIDETIKKIIENSGEIIIPKNPIPGIGWIAYFKDPESNVFGVMQEDKKAK